MDWNSALAPLREGVLRVVECRSSEPVEVLRENGLDNRHWERGNTTSEQSNLRGLLRRLDGQLYSQYRSLIGRHQLGEFEVVVDRVPPDPYAGGARVRLVVERQKANLPGDLTRPKERRLGVEAYLSARVVEALRHQFGSGRRQAPGSGQVYVEPFDPAVLERSVCRVSAECIELRLLVDLPASARRIRGAQVEQLFCTGLLRLATSVLLFSERAACEARDAADTMDDHLELQRELSSRGLVSFVADDSLLARGGGADNGPRRDGHEVAFRSPDSLALELELPHAGKVRGMGIPAGVTVIVGGGFHGKSTLLDAIASAVHPHLSGDGRARVATIPEAVIIRAEDGRSVRRVDISGFLGRLPSGARSADFSTEKASGSTSQASAIVEALEVGARLLLLDEDRCATNFMIRDGRMQRLVPRPGEPIIPFLDRVRELYDRFGVSTILVTGGSGDYLEVADTVIRMDAYLPHDVTQQAKEVARTTQSMRLSETIPPFELPATREPRTASGFRPQSLRTSSRGARAVRVGDETVSLRELDQLVEAGQVRALGRLMRSAAMRMADGKDMATLIDEVEGRLDAEGLDSLDPPVAYDLSRPRRFELAAALNRWRALLVARPGTER